MYTIYIPNTTAVDGHRNEFIVCSVHVALCTEPLAMRNNDACAFEQQTQKTRTIEVQLATEIKQSLSLLVLVVVALLPLLSNSLLVLAMHAYKLQTYT
jgi:uncharacterized membrane protein